jgi:hypothetical protein
VVLDTVSEIPPQEAQFLQVPSQGYLNNEITNIKN